MSVHFDAYQKLKDRFSMLSGLSGAGSILYMDSMTVMASGSEGDRSEQTMALASAAHILLTDPRVGEWLDEAESGLATLSLPDQRNLALMRRHSVIATTLPESLVREKARLETEGNNLHTAYRDKGDWSVMKPVYERAFDISREVGEILKDRLGLASPYEALLDQFSPGLRLATVEREFVQLEKALPPMIAERRERQSAEPPALPIGLIPITQQKVLNEALVKKLGFDSNRGVFYSGDMHPLSGGTPDDSRMTTRYHEQNVFDGLYTTIHETGHSLYEQGTPRAWRYQPVGHTLGMDIHESQSMIMQYQACMIPEFIEYLAGELQSLTGTHHNPVLTAENVKRVMYHVTPSFIRVNADELTYPGHIIMRFNLEQALIEKRMTIDDLPSAWNESMQTIFGITPPDAAHGHMQDVHWPVLSIGYFPAYTLGAMGAAQFFRAAVTAHPHIRRDIGQGDFGALRQWLLENIHERASLQTPAELFTSATGEPLNARYYLNHLSTRYLGREYQ